MTTNDLEEAKRICPKTGRIIDPGNHLGMKRSGISRWFLPVGGFLALIWFLIRVIPKPSRATYPCQKAAAPLAAAFVVWVSGLVGSLAAGRRLRRLLIQRRYQAALGFAVLILVIGGIAVVGLHSDTQSASIVGPVGVGVGINPGRVVWCHDPDATSWDGESGYWWEDEHTDQAVVDRMFHESLLALTGGSDARDSWERLFRYANTKLEGESAPYSAGEKVVVKLNLNTQDRHTCIHNTVDLSPQVVLAFVRSLVRDGGIPEEDVTMYDASRWVADKIYDRVKAEFPGVVFVDNQGGDGREKVVPDPRTPIYYDGIGIDTPDLLPTCVSEAKYMVNISIMKKHTLAGITAAAKNHFGSIFRTSDSQWSPSHLHDFVTTTTRPMGSANPLVSLMGHKELGGKTILYIVDGMYPGMQQSNENPSRFWMPPFNGDWTSSMFMSQDPVAIESVLCDFFAAERGVPANTRNYLVEAALANDPPSATRYDPERDGTPLQSLGVHETWNNQREKRYSGNDNPGTGIELIALRTGGGGK